MNRARKLACLISICSAIAAAQCRFAGKPKGETLAYTFEPSITPSSLVLHVTLQFRGSPSGIDHVELPSHWAGQTLAGVTNLRAVAGDTIIDAGHTIRHQPNRPVTLTYDMVKDWEGPFRHPLQFHGVLLPEYLEINGDNALVHPRLPAETPVTVHFDWQKLPPSWTLATSFGTGERCQSYTGPWSSVEDALFAAGDFRVRRFPVGNRQVTLAIRGQWTFSDDEALAAIRKAIGAARDFFRDDRFPYFLVTLKPYDTERGSSDGSGFTNAFWLYLSRQDSLSAQLPLIVHEALHAWNPRRMGRVSGTAQAIDWFHEGFTEYYAWLLVQRAGWLPLPAYLENLNRDLRNPAASRSPYIRGRLIALWLDQQIRRESAGRKSLDDLMRDMVRERDHPLTRERILQTAARYLSATARADLERAVIQGVPAPTPGELAPCARRSMDELPLFDLGFDLPASREAHRITGITPDGPAFRAGLRNGDSLLAVSVYQDQPGKLAKFTLGTAGGSRTIEYYPRGRSTVVPQYHATAAADCRL